MLHALPTRITKADDSAWSKLVALAAQLEPGIAKALLAALEKVASLIDLEAVAKALEAGRVDHSPPGSMPLALKALAARGARR